MSLRTTDEPRGESFSTMRRTVKKDLVNRKPLDFLRVTLYVYVSGTNIMIFHEPMPNTERLEFTFWEMTNGLWEELERYSLEEYSPHPRENLKIFNHRKMKEFYLRHMFRSWNLDVPLSFDEEGKLDDCSWEKVMRLHPAILRELADNVFNYTLTDEETSAIARQCHLLFSKGTAVNSPHQMISLYCTLVDMWKNFGLNYFDLQRLPIKIRNGLRLITSQENQIQNAKYKEMEAKSKARNARMGRR